MKYHGRDGVVTGQAGSGEPQLWDHARASRVLARAPVLPPTSALIGSASPWHGRSGLGIIIDMPDENAARVQRLVRLTRLMDSQFRVPGTQWRFGLDPLVGLIPVVGDVTGAGVSLWIVAEAHRMGIPARTTARMLGNVALDLATGAIPILGDVFDAGYKANSRNIRLLERHLGR